jgi:threonine synthase
MPEIIAFRCVNAQCQTDYHQPYFSGCPRCLQAGIHANLYAVYADDPRSPQQIKATWLADRSAGIWRFADRLPDITPAYRLSLGEGNTPLVTLPGLAQKLGWQQVWLKDESRNPTWSWKDRLMAMAVSAGLAAGATAIAGSSTGNAGAALAAYAARAGLPAYIFATAPLPDTMRVFMQSFGAHLFVVPTRDNRFDMVRLGMAERGWYPVTNLSEPPTGSNSYGLEGYKTLAFEIGLDLDMVMPDLILVPTSNGDGLFGIWRGLVELQSLGLTNKMPRLMAVRPAESATSAFSLGRPPESPQVQLVLEETRGQTVFIPETEIIAMQLMLAATEGLYLEAASVVGLCALKQLDPASAERVVVVGTSSGLKDPATTAQFLPPIPQIEPTLAALDQALSSS